jgi:hypothetical protein
MPSGASLGRVDRILRPSGGGMRRADRPLHVGRGPLVRERTCNAVQPKANAGNRHGSAPRPVPAWARGQPVALCFHSAASHRSIPRRQALGTKPKRTPLRRERRAGRRRRRAAGRRASVHERFSRRASPRHRAFITCAYTSRLQARGYVSRALDLTAVPAMARAEERSRWRFTYRPPRASQLPYFATIAFARSTHAAM